MAEEGDISAPSGPPPTENAHISEELSSDVNSEGKRTGGKAPRHVPRRRNLSEVTNSEGSAKAAVDAVSKKAPDSAAEKVAAGSAEKAAVATSENATVAASEKTAVVAPTKCGTDAAAEKAVGASSENATVSASETAAVDATADSRTDAAAEKAQETPKSSTALPEDSSDARLEYPPSVVEGQKYYSAYPVIRSHDLRNKGINVVVSEGERAGAYRVFGLEEYGSKAFWDAEKKTVGYELIKYSDINFSDELLSSEERFQFDINSRAKPSLDYMYRSGCACHIPFGTRKLPEYDPTPLEHGNHEASEHRDKDGNIIDFSKLMPISIERLHYSGVLDISEMKSSMLWSQKPINNDACFTTHVLLCDSQILKPDVTRWRLYYS